MRTFEEILNDNAHRLLRGGAIATVLQAARHVELAAIRTIETLNFEIQGCVRDFANDFEQRFTRKPDHPLPHIIKRDEDRARWANWGAWFLIIFKTFVWILFGPVQFAYVPWVASVVGGLMSITLSLALKNSIALWTVKGGLTPNEQENRINKIFNRAMIFVGLSFSGFLLVRAGVMGAVAALGFFDIALLILAGVMFGKKFFYGWSGQHAGRFRYLLDVRQQLELQHAEAQHTISSRDVTSSSSTTRVVPQLTNVAISIVMLATIVTSARAQVAVTTTPNLKVGTSQQIFLLPRTASRTRGELDMDISHSVDPSALRDAAEVLRAVLPKWVIEANSNYWDLNVLEGDAWTARRIARIEVARSEKSPCNNSAPQEGRVFRQLAERAASEKISACESWRSAQRTSLTPKIDKALEDALKSVPTRRLGCTSVYDALARLSALPEGSVGVLITDGIESCVNRRMLSAPSHSPTVVVILIASRGDFGKGRSASMEFERRKLQLLKDAPWLSGVFAPFEVQDIDLIPGNETDKSGPRS